MSAHTPGPWFMSTTFGQQGLIGPKDYSPVASVTGYYTLHGQTEANARLIAAAPELLNILRKCRDYLSCIPESSAGGDDDAVMLAQEASSVIAKATGEQL